MFDKHPKGLIAAALANLGERFGFYTMMAILVLFSQRKRSKKALPPVYLRPVRFCGKKLRVFAAMVIQGFCRMCSVPDAGVSQCV